MTIRELVLMLVDTPLVNVKYKINPDAVVYITADHGQTSEQASRLSTSTWTNKLPYHGDKIFIHPDDLAELKAEGDKSFGDKITAIEIS